METVLTGSLVYLLSRSSERQKPAASRLRRDTNGFCFEKKIILPLQLRLRKLLAMSWDQLTETPQNSSRIIEQTLLEKKGNLYNWKFPPEETLHQQDKEPDSESQVFFQLDWLLCNKRFQRAALLMSLARYTSLDSPGTIIIYVRIGNQYHFRCDKGQSLNYGY